MAAPKTPPDTQHAAAGPTQAGGWWPLAATLAVLLLLAGAVRWLWHGYEVQTAQERSLAQPHYTELAWDALVPKDWDPLRRYRDAGIDRLDGARVRLSGYVVPLDMQRADMREFLLVPYFGACIHVPAPAANQLVHVRLGAATAKLRTMDTVWVSGTLHTRRNDSPMGVSAYTLAADHVERRPVLGR